VAVTEGYGLGELRLYFNQFATGLEILKIYEPRSGIWCEKRGQTLFFDPMTSESNEMVQYALGKLIMSRAVIRPDCHARYRFRQEILALVNQPFTGIMDGWIFPTATTVLVNVKETGKADMWIGQVEGSEDHGMFLCTHCNVHCSSMSLTFTILRQLHGMITVTGRLPVIMPRSDSNSYPHFSSTCLPLFLQSDMYVPSQGSLLVAKGLPNTQIIQNKPKGYDWDMTRTKHLISLASVVQIMQFLLPSHYFSHPTRPSLNEKILQMVAYW
jgi:hypothetical protein